MATQDAMQGMSGALTGAGTGLSTGLSLAAAGSTAAGPVGWILGSVLALSALTAAGINSKKRKEYGAAQSTAMDKNFNESMNDLKYKDRQVREEAARSNQMNRLGLRDTAIRSRANRDAAKDKLSDARVGSLNKTIGNYNAMMNPQNKYNERLVQMKRWS